MTLWERIARHNAPLLARLLRGLADEALALYPGPPAWSYPLAFRRPQGGFVMADITVKDTDADLTANVQFVDQHGHPTQPDDTPEWTSSDESVCTVEPDDDGLSAVIVIEDTPGATVIEVSSTDTDGTIVAAQGTVTVTSGEAAMGEVTFSPTA